MKKEWREKKELRTWLYDSHVYCLLSLFHVPRQGPLPWKLITCFKDLTI